MDTQKHQYLPIARKQPTKFGRCTGGVLGRTIRLCVLGIIMPVLMVAAPLYLKYRVYSQHLVPLSMSDMRIIDNKISTTWCQRQHVTSNATFNAYLMGNSPSVTKTNKFVNLKREMVLEDDMKEYWGFYLLKGSTVTVSSCARRAGASLIVIRGHHHLRQCAYIGDDSSEEEEEKEQQTTTQDKKYSNRKRLEKVRPEVMFSNNKNVSQESLIKNQLDVKDGGDEFDMELLAEHRAKTRRPQATPQLTSQEIFKAALEKFRSYKIQGKNAMEQVRKHLTQNSTKNIESNRERRSIHEWLMKDEETLNNAEEQEVEHSEVRGRVNGTTANDTSNSEFWSSFSSSEERLLECAGLIVSQPLTQSELCYASATLDSKHSAAQLHRITYSVPVNGYYFFVFSSENEIEENYIWTEFILEKMQYDVSDAVASCENSTGECSLPLHFFSEERIVLEVPINESLWNSEFLVVSTCEPRTALYVACVVTVPILILLFAL